MLLPDTHKNAHTVLIIFVFLFLFNLDGVFHDSLYCQGQTDGLFFFTTVRFPLKWSFP